MRFAAHSPGLALHVGTGRLILCQVAGAVRKQTDVGGFPRGDANGRVEVWRGGFVSNISVSASFVWRCLSGSTMTPFPHPAYRTGHADFPHPALGHELHAFAHDTSRPSALRRTSPKCP